MPTKYRIALTEDVYLRLKELQKALGLESPNQVLKHVLFKMHINEIVLRLCYGKFISYLELRNWINGLSLDEKIEVSHKVIEESLRVAKTLFRDVRADVAFSGGKASLVTLDLVLHHVPRDEIIVHYSNSLNDFPETRNYVVDVAKNFYKIRKFVEIVPRFKPFDVWKTFGFPHPGRLKRYTPVCCIFLKELPAKLVIEKYNINIDFTGIQAFESLARFMSIADNGLVRRTKFVGHDVTLNHAIIRVSPIGLWTDEDVWSYIKRNNLPANPAYEKYKIKRTGCILCTNYLNWEEELRRLDSRLAEQAKRLVDEYGFQEKRVRKIDEAIQKLGFKSFDEMYAFVEYFN